MGNKEGDEAGGNERREAIQTCRKVKRATDEGRDGIKGLGNSEGQATEWAASAKIDQGGRRLVADAGAPLASVRAFQ